jgi:hypothetical protein
MKRLLFTLFVLTLLPSLFTLPTVQADMAFVPQTGQTKSYVAGDDGDAREGVPWPNPRFTDNANGTVTDNLTGLVWLQNAGCSDSVGGIAGGQMTWANAISWSNNMATGKCGVTDGSKVGDWRLPNRKELKSMINRQQAVPVSGLFYSVADYYWSSSTVAYVTGYAWIVDMGYGNVDINVKGNYSHVWPVRSGQ